MAEYNVLDPTGTPFASTTAFQTQFDKIQDNADFTATPSTVITAGANLSWDGNTLNSSSGSSTTTTTETASRDMTDSDVNTQIICNNSSALVFTIPDLTASVGDVIAIIRNGSGAVSFVSATTGGDTVISTDEITDEYVTFNLTELSEYEFEADSISDATSWRYVMRFYKDSTEITSSVDATKISMIGYGGVSTFFNATTEIRNDVNVTGVHFGFSNIDADRVDIKIAYGDVGTSSTTVNNTQTLIGSGSDVITLNKKSGTLASISDQYTSAGLIKTGTSEWMLFGSLSSSS